MEEKKVLIVGAGRIGQCIQDRLVKMSHLATSSGFFDPRFDGDLGREIVGFSADAVFLAISTKDRGEAARGYLNTCLRINVPIITCEKGSFAYFGHEFISHLDMIGHSAVVGGGTQILSFVRRRKLLNKPFEINVVLNASLNFIFDEMSRGRTYGEAMVEAGNLGCFEPKSEGPLGILNSELCDIILKTCAFYNIALVPKMCISPTHIGTLNFNDSDLEELVRGGADYRFVVTFSGLAPLSKKIEYFGDPGRHYFRVYCDGCTISGGFRRITGDSDLLSWLPHGIGNAIQIVEGKFGQDGKYVVSGPGAGPGPTVSAMVDDFEALCS